MSMLHFDEKNALHYRYQPPGDQKGCTFVFFNALAGDAASWEAGIVPTLIAQGHGALVFNFRGQTDSPFVSDLILDDRLIVSDATRLLTEIKPLRPIFVGLSIGGLFAAKTYLAGAEAVGLVFVNTLRRQSVRLSWVNDALARSVEIGGLELLKDLFLPLLMNNDWLTANRSNFLTSAAYTPVDRSSGPYKLLNEAGRRSDWNLPYEKLDLPTLVITGLRDHIFYSEKDVTELTARISKARRVNMENAGHMIPGERPEEFTAILTDFAKELNAN